MEDIERNNEAEKINDAPHDPITEPEKEAADTEAVNTAETVTSEENAPEAEVTASGNATEANDTASENAPVPAEPQAQTVYHWNYAESRAFDERQGKQKGKKAAVIYAAAVSVAFVLCFAALIFTLIFDIMPYSNGANAGTSETVVRVEERYVYVREDDTNSGVLTPQEIYNKCLPSTVSIIVSDGASSGTGSGFFITTDGYIATANHVVESMSSVKVLTSSGELYDAAVVGGNDYTDIAVLKIDKTDCPAIKIGSSDKLLVGDDVVAIGTPASTDFAGSMAKGSVSYKNRMLKIKEPGVVQKKMRLIQTDALVNPGNSGCPLINEYGEAVGIVTMKLNSTYYEGMCFAIPMDAAMPIIEAMMQQKDYQHLLGAVSTPPAVLGISAQSFEIAEAGVKGVRIEEFTSPDYDIAAKLKIGDIITEVDGVAVASVNEVRIVIDKFFPGDTVSLTFYRDGQYMTVNIVMGS